MLAVVYAKPATYLSPLSPSLYYQSPNELIAPLAPAPLPLAYNRLPYAAPYGYDNNYIYRQPISYSLV